MTDRSPLAAAAPPTSRRLAVRDRWLFLVAFIPFFALYLVTANKDLPYHIDAVTNVYTAWTIGTTGSPILKDHAVLAEPEFYSTFAQVVASNRGPVSQYPPGTALLAAPLYATFARDAEIVSLVSENDPAAAPVRLPVPNLLPAAIVAAAVSAGTVAILALLLRQIGATDGALAGWLVVIGLGTGLWSVAADALWQHGPNALLAVLGVWLASRNRWFGSGLAFGALALTRAPVILVGVAIGMGLLVSRQFRPALRLLGGAIPGVLALLAYNWWLFGQPSITGAYGSSFTTHAAEADAAGYVANIASGLFDSQYGLVVWTPVVAVAALGLHGAIRAAPRWTIMSAVGGLAYLLLQWKANRASGGDGFTYYRYPIETLVVAAPLLYLSARTLWEQSSLARPIVVITSLFAIGAHAMGAF